MGFHVVGRLLCFLIIYFLLHTVFFLPQAKYKPNKNITGDKDCTLFVGRLNPDTDEKSLMKVGRCCTCMESISTIIQFIIELTRVESFHCNAQRWHRIEFRSLWLVNFCYTRKSFLMGWIRCVTCCASHIIYEKPTVSGSFNCVHVQCWLFNNKSDSNNF